jgi:site-specific DNA-methyltransferase (adenine-specific)
MTELIYGDCLKILPSIPSKSIDFICADIPYGTTQCKWDVVIPFDLMWPQLNRVIKNNGAIALFGSEPFSSALRMSNIKNFKYDWIWDKIKGTGFLNAKKQPMRNHEIISIFYENQCTYNPQKTTGHKLKQSSRNKHHQTKVYGDMKNNYYYESTTRYPRSIQAVSSDTQNSSLHSTQKPVKLIEYFINTYTNEGETVLDFTCGSGTSLVGCHNTKRNGIGIENDVKIYDIAKKRLDLHKQQLTLF